MGMGSPNSEVSQISVECRTRSECENFLNALKPPVIPQPRVIQSPPPAVPARVQNTSLKDISDAITWRNGGTKTLDELANKTTAPAQERRRQPSQQPTFAAFAQSAGFDANSGWGAATGTDLNSTIGAANTTCANRAGTSCGDEGYCMLRPGLWGAWASDLKYLGSKGRACNYKTQQEAEQTALAWCGSQGCRVLWSGGAQ